jgi:hypothetical protein
MRIWTRRWNETTERKNLYAKAELWDYGQEIDELSVHLTSNFKLIRIVKSLYDKLPGDRYLEIIGWMSTLWRFRGIHSVSAPAQETSETDGSSTSVKAKDPPCSILVVGSNFKESGST